MRFADDYVAGFEHREDAERFLADLRGRFAEFGLELHPDKTRLIEFGRFAADNRERRGLRKPDTFDFLGLTHMCAKDRHGRFKLKRVTSKKKMRAKLKAVKAEMRWRMHHPIPDQGRWLASVLQGHYNYYAVPDNSEALRGFRERVTTGRIAIGAYPAPAASLKPRCVNGASRSSSRLCLPPGARPGATSNSMRCYHRPRSPPRCCQGTCCTRCSRSGSPRSSGRRDTSPTGRRR